MYENEIGGFFELDLNPGKEFHDNCLRLSTDRK